MTRHAWNTVLLVSLSLAAAIPIACGGSGSGTSGGSGGSSTESGTGAQSGTLAGSGGSGGSIFNPDAGMMTLQIVPPSATIDVQNGMSSPIDFDARLGTSLVNASWIVDLSAIGDVDGNGVVTASGTQGGLLKLRATYQGQTAEALVTVNLHQLSNPGGATGPDQGILKGATTPDGTIQWTYPYDRTVFPKGLLPPELMWNNGGTDDLYYVHFVGKYVDLEVFAKAAPPSRFALDEASWRALTESGPGGAVKVTVARLLPGATSATVVVNHEWTIANGSLRGTVYYWANSIGRILRIKPGASAPEDFLAAGGQTGCSTCHAVSANGSTLIIGGDIAVSTWDLLSNSMVLNLQTVGKAVRNWAMPAISPNGKVLVENNAPLPGPPGGSDAMWDAQTGQKLANTGLDGVFLDMPAFGPDGTKIAFVYHNAANASQRHLGVYDYDATAVFASNPVTLVQTGPDPNLNTICFPSVSPDAKWVVYHRGTPGSLDTRTGPGNLFLASVIQPGLEIRLGNMNGDAYPFAAGDRDRNYNYEPTYAPLNAGGFMWVVFTSRRTYGNRLTGPAFVADGVGTKQLWVAAIDQDPVPGTDPSHPAFWVPGQDLGTLNMRGFWALDPCKPVGANCNTGSECCNQNCVGGICEDPDPNGCSATGNACMTDADCCGVGVGVKCINGFCSEPPPP